MAFADSFSGTSLGTQWTFEAGTPATTLTVADGECRIVAKTGASYEAPTQTSDADTSFGITQSATDAGITGDFDIAVQAPTSLRSWTDIGWGIAFYGATKTSDHVVLGQRTVDGNAANSTAVRILSRVASTLTTHVDDVARDEEYSFIRVTRAGSTWTIYGSWNGAAWTSLASFSAAITVDAVKVYGVVLARQLGTTLRISETYDVTGTDLRAPVDTLSGATTWTTDFTSGVPSWLEDRSTNGGSATVVSNILELSKTTADKSSAFVAHNVRVSDVDLLVKFRLNTDQLGSPNQFLVFGIGGQHQSDQYSYDKSYIIEADEDFNNVLPLRVHLRNRNNNFNAPYDFGPAASPAGWGNDQWQWVRFQRIGNRIRYRGWADGSVEPSTWDFDAHNELWETPGQAWITWSQNSTGTASTTALVDQVTIQGVEVAESPPGGVDAIPGMIGRWRADSLDGLADLADVEGWADISSAEQRSLWRQSTDAPTYELAEIGGKNTVRFSALGAQRLANNLNFPPWIDRSAVTMVAVCKLAVATGTQVILDGHDVTAPAGRNALFVSAGTWRYFAGAVVDSADATNLNSHVVTTTFATTRTNSAQYLDGTQIGAGDPGAQILKTLYVGSEDTGDNPANIFIAEILLFNRELTTSDRTTLHSYVQDRYGITVSDYTDFKLAGVGFAAQDATVTSSADISANTALLGVSALDATVQVSGNETADALTADLSVAAQDATISTSPKVQAEVATISFEVGDTDKRAIAQEATINFGANDASISITADPKTNVTPTTASVGVAALNATVTISEQITADAFVATVSVSANDATVTFIDPAPATYSFFPPVVTEHLAHLQDDPFLQKITWEKGVSVVRKGSTFVDTRHVVPDPGGPEDELTEGEDYFVGGHRYSGIPESVALELIAAGYEPILEEA